MVVPIVFVAILLLPLVSLFLRYISLRGHSADQATVWQRHRRSNHAVLLITLIAWCALWELPTVASLPRLLFWIAPIFSTALLEGLSRLGDSDVLMRTWTAMDILRLACWSTVAPPIALLMVAAGLHAILDGFWVGAFWVVGAGIAAICRTLAVAVCTGDKTPPREVRHVI
jgi:hypothetical protein